MLTYAARRPVPLLFSPVVSVIIGPRDATPPRCIVVQQGEGTNDLETPRKLAESWNARDRETELVESGVERRGGIGKLGSWDFSMSG